MARRIHGNGFVIIDRSLDYLRSAQTQSERVITAAAIKTQTEAKRLLNLASFPPPSDPGDPPHKRTGTLGRSIDFETGERRGVFVARVGTNLRYGFWLELGTRRMAPRPYLRPALRKGTQTLELDLAKAYKQIK